MWKDFLYFTKTERRGIIVLVVLIIGVYAVSSLLSVFNPPETGQPEKDEVFEQEYAAFIASLKEKEEKERKWSGKTYRYKEKEKGKSASGISPAKVRLFAFDPNTADSATFIRLGLSSRVARNILRYRARQGTFSRPDDFRKIYGLTEEQYRLLFPYIRIARQDTMPRTDESLLSAEQPRRHAASFKYPPGTVIELNRADTTELKKIPGIGSVLARRIVDYRRQLGAFYRIEQLAEIHLKVEKLRTWFSIDTTLIHPLPVNTASVERMMKHPYLDFYQAKAIYEHRRKFGDIRSLQELALYEEFTPTDFERLKPYVRFN